MVQLEEQNELLTTLEERIDAVRGRFEELVDAVAGDLHSLHSMGSQDNGSPALNRLHLSRKLEEDISAAVRDEKEDMLNEFLQSRRLKSPLPTQPPPPPPPLPSPSAPPAAAVVMDGVKGEMEEERRQLSRLTAEARASLIAKEKIISSLRVELEDRQRELAEHALWRETTAQYAVILINAVQNNSAVAAGEGRTVPDSTVRLCATLATHLGLGTGGESFSLPDSIKHEVRRRSTVLAKCFSPASVARRRSLYCSDSVEEEELDCGVSFSDDENRISQRQNTAAPLPFLVLGGEEDAASSLFDFYAMVNREIAVARASNTSATAVATAAAANSHFVGRKTFLLLALVLGVVDERVTLTFLCTAFDRVVLLRSTRGQKQKFSARLELNDFVSALGLVADVKFSETSSSLANCMESNSSLRNPRLSLLLKAVSSEARVLAADPEARKRWIDTFSPCVEDDVFVKLAENQNLLFTSYGRAKSYGIFIDDHSSGKSDPARREANRGLLQSLGLPPDTLLSATRRLASSQGTASPSTTTSTTSTLKRLPPAQVSVFETFCVNSRVVPLLVPAMLPRRIAQFLSALDNRESFRVFLACVAYLGIALSEPVDVRVANTEGGKVKGRTRFAEAIDKILSLVDSGVVAH